MTGEAARRRAHMLRATHDAILVGTGTALADDPELTCRLGGLEDRSPVRVVLDRQLRIPPTNKLLSATKFVPTWLVTHFGNSRAAGLRAMEGNDITAIAVLLDEFGRLSLPHVLRVLADQGITRLLVESGGTLAAGLLHADLVDRIYWFRAATIIGADGVPAAQAFGVERLADAKRFERVDTEIVGKDMLEIYRRS